MKNIAGSVTDFLSPMIIKMGYELIDVEYAKKSNGMNLTVFIDKTGGVDIDDCERVHRAIDPVLDDLNPTDDAPYTLNVSSVGLDRPIKTDKDLNRVMGVELEASLFVPIDKKKKWIGSLVAYTPTTITLCKDDISVELSRDKISKLEIYLDF